MTDKQIINSFGQSMTDALMSLAMVVQKCNLLLETDSPEPADMYDVLQLIRSDAIEAGNKLCSQLEGYYQR